MDTDTGVCKGGPCRDATPPAGGDLTIPAAPAARASEPAHPPTATVPAADPPGDVNAKGVPDMPPGSLAAGLTQLLLPPMADTRGDRRPCTTATSAPTRTLRPTTTVVTESPAPSQTPALAQLVESGEPWCCVCCVR